MSTARLTHWMGRMGQVPRLGITNMPIASVSSLLVKYACQSKESLSVWATARLTVRHLAR